MVDFEPLKVIYEYVAKLRKNKRFNTLRKIFVFVLAFKDIFISWNHTSLI